MTHSFQKNPITASQLMIALSESFPDLTYGAVPVADQFGSLEQFFARGGSALAKAPDALLAQTIDRRQCK